MNPRPGILHIITDLRLGGAQRMLLARIRGCPGFRHAVLAFETHTGTGDEAGPDLAEEVRQAGAGLHTLGTRTPGAALRLWLSGGLQGRLQDILREERPDLIHSTLYHGHLLGAVAASRARLPHLAAKEGLDSWMGWIPRRLEARALRRAGGVMAVSRAAAEAVRSLGIPANRIRVIHNGIDLEGIESEPALKTESTPGHASPDRAGSDRAGSARSDKADPAGSDWEGTGREETGPSPAVALLGIGRLTEAKGWGDLIEAYVRIRKEEPSIELEIYGHGSLGPRLEQTCTGLGLDSSRILPGPGPGVDRILHLHPRPLMVLPSREEGFGLVLLEAMARGVPIVATTAGGISEVVRDGVEALLVPPRDPEALADAILRLAREPGLYRKLGQAGLRRVREFDQQRMLDAYQEWVEELLRQGPGRRREG